MTILREKAIARRKFLPVDLVVTCWTDLEPYALRLLDFKLSGVSDLENWLKMRSEFDSVLEEDKAWLFIKQSSDTSNSLHADAFSEFVKNIEEKYAMLSNQLNEKLIDFCSRNNYPAEYEIFIRTVKRQIEIFRDENVSIQSALEVEEQQYGAITGAMVINYKDEELTLQKAQNILKSVNRRERKIVFKLIWERRLLDSEKLQSLLTGLLDKRQQIARNAGYINYLEYRFAQLGRFDYSIADCERFHESVAEAVVPVVEKINEARRKALQLNALKPFDLEVDVDHLPPLKPFNSVSELTKRTIACFSEIDKDFGSFLSIMEANGYLDLDSRKGKAPGGYNYPLHESNVPFIFMNATHNLRDLETMVHEGGHAIHSFLSSDLEFVYYKETPAEIAEVASMAMELISMEHWHHFFPDSSELRRAKLSQLEGVISVLPWVATIDKFQHWMYTHPGHTAEERTKAWIDTEEKLAGNIVNWEGLEKFHKITWQKQIHLFQFPLYYIEYGIAQLGAIALWKNYKANRKVAISAYRKALAMGYSKSLPELYKAACIEFNFSRDYILSLVDFVWSEYENLSKAKH
jgi:oligoendopeptidase F